MKKICILVLAILLLAAGCAKKQLVKEEKYQPIQPWATTPRILDAIDESQKQSAKKAEEALLQKIKPKPRAKIEMSSVEILTGERCASNRVGGVQLRFTLRESNGVSVEFDKYLVTVSCAYTGFIKGPETSKTGTFLLKDPIKLSALETSEFIIYLSQWVSKTANSMSKPLRKEEYRLQLILSGKDEYGNQVTITSETSLL